MEELSFYKDILFYNGKFYTESDLLKTVSLHNRLYTPFMPSKISDNIIDDDNNILYFNKGILLLDSFHSNIGHLLWDFMYPSWYGLFYFLENNSNDDFQWITEKDIDPQNGGWHLDILEKFSGNPITTLNLFSKLYDKPIRIPWLIAGMSVGIGCVNTNLLVKRELKDHINDPIEMFINRMYSRYNIERNIINNINTKNIIYIVNKRPQYGIEYIFEKLKIKYNGYNFNIINLYDYNFNEQLNIFNNSCIIIVGVGTARINSPFLPNGAIEIQIGDYDSSSTNFIQYFDYHHGTLSKYIKVLNIEYYTKEEAEQRLVSGKLENYIETAIENIPFNVPINLEDNIPLEIKKIENKIKNNLDIFKQWRNSGSNNIKDLLNILK